MEDLFEQLTRCKDDEQQRNWMLYEDEVTIRDLLQVHHSFKRLNYKLKRNLFFSGLVQQPSDVQPQRLPPRAVQIQVLLRALARGILSDGDKERNM